ncbi:hypothetical protein AU196_15645 [Mycobacterium sp. IS-1742]|uniref:hypothetical protein n=1 Tax=Mycobacterium sp. IS-1742 TaxID=1772285 RepID=UPI0007400B11|nr:hypothetical protein [Mycobacterium sp. IS-1742]KUI24754.1 hypothetical protein AU196_15645 [Mycobacterium sp. IS-1742]
MIKIIAIIAALAGQVLLASPAHADYYSYMDALENSGLLVYERPPRCIDRTQMDPLCPVRDKFYSEDEAADIAIWICGHVYRGALRRNTIESISFGEGPKYTVAAAEAIYDIATTYYC